MRLAFTDDHFHVLRGSQSAYKRGADCPNVGEMKACRVALAITIEEHRETFNQGQSRGMHETDAFGQCWPTPQIA